MAESNVPRLLKLSLSFTLIILGLLFYILWGIAYGSWNFFQAKFITVYCITIVLVLSGALGILLVRTEKKEA